MSYSYPQMHPKIKPIVFWFMRLYARIVNFFFVKRLDTEGMEHISDTKPILFAATHANSFYDAILLHIETKRYVHALARGDAFNNKAVAFILDLVHILPIWRITEGKHNMAKNNQTFDRCHELLRNNKQVLIYPEGRCKNQTTLLPLKKMGTSALALRAWKDGIDVEVVPVVSTYDSFKNFGKRINLKIAKPLRKEDFDLSQDSSEFAKVFTAKLTEEMEAMIDHTFKPVGFLRNMVHYLGWLIHLPLFLFIHWFTKKKFGPTIFFDSVWYGIFYVTAGPYWLLLGILISQFL
ncbi:1-acyl-sn-glycerol-3-phosphate acyltransferase [Jiulongibacter sediminis]|uniref:1-acyl-sn-glycerol-3-phosphate acyltransferase n=1 Tax=Jiulongibacter sediminis TaxID=1605367 RepID=UPI0026ECCBEE|nr:1-acyl-sn-glycerol-3-phosphate acyltransferase [Jiulongibacter sediminis]